MPEIINVLGEKVYFGSWLGRPISFRSLVGRQHIMVGPYSSAKSFILWPGNKKVDMERPGIPQFPSRAHPQ
jgi:hypothetical protein